MSAVKRVEFVGDRISHIILRGCWCHIIVLNVHAPTEDKTDDMKDSLCEHLECVFYKFPEYHTKILLDFNAKVSREDIFIPIGNESLHEISNGNGVRVIYLAFLKISQPKVQCSHVASFINILGRFLIGKPTIRLSIFW
jgi:hypothetical protein